MIDAQNHNRTVFLNGAKRSAEEVHLKALKIRLYDSRNNIVLFHIIIKTHDFYRTLIFSFRTKLTFKQVRPHAVTTQLPLTVGVTKSEPDRNDIGQLVHRYGLLHQAIVFCIRLKCVDTPAIWEEPVKHQRRVADIRACVDNVLAIGILRMINQIKSVIAGKSACLEDVHGKLEVSAGKAVIIEPRNPEVLFLIPVYSLSLIRKVAGSVTILKQVLDPANHRFYNLYVFLWEPAYQPVVPFLYVSTLDGVVKVLLPVAEAGEKNPGSPWKIYFICEITNTGRHLIELCADSGSCFPEFFLPGYCLISLGR